MPKPQKLYIPTFLSIREFIIIPSHKYQSIPKQQSRFQYHHPALVSVPESPDSTLHLIVFKNNTRTHNLIYAHSIPAYNIPCGNPDYPIPNPELP